MLLGLRGRGRPSRRVCQRRAENATAAIAPASTKTIASPAGSRVTSSITAPTSAAHGIVITHATRMLPATPQRTAESRRDAPAPMTEPEIVCVVETGKP